jgi:hypothetical protein
MNAVNIGLTIAGIGVVVVLAIVIKEFQCSDDEESLPYSEYDEDDEGISEEGCRDTLLFLIGAALIVVGLLISGIAWFISLL